MFALYFCWISPLLRRRHRLCLSRFPLVHFRDFLLLRANAENVWREIGLEKHREVGRVRDDDGEDRGKEEGPFFCTSSLCSFQLSFPRKPEENPAGDSA